jgi:hypothetical protein
VNEWMSEWRMEWFKRCNCLVDLLVVCSGACQGSHLSLENFQKGQWGSLGQSIYLVVSILTV